MPEYADIYTASTKRTEEAIIRFLNHFLPSRIESADEYEVPQYSRTPRIIFSKATELIRYCCDHSHEVHCIYWRSDLCLEQVEVFFLSDGGLIFGIATPADNSNQIDSITSRLEQFMDTEEIVVSYEELPPESLSEFQSLYRSLPANPDELARHSKVHRPIKYKPADAGNETKPGV